MSKHHHVAGNGKHGSSREKHGRNGINKVIRVPCGVVVKRILDYDEVWDDESQCVKKIGTAWIDDLDDDDGYVVKEGEGQKLNVYDDHASSSEPSSESEEEDDEMDGYFSYDEDTDDEDNVDYWSDSDDSDELNGYENESDNDDENDNDLSPKRDRASVVNTGIKGDDGMYHFEPPPLPKVPVRGPMSNEQWKTIFGVGDEEDGEDTNKRRGGREKVVLADLDKPGSYLLVSQGGKGGKGNSTLAKRQYIDNVLEKAYARSAGTPGEIAFLELELKLIADLGLVGFPNAGKSSLLAATSMAKPEIAPYPFTTLHPLVGSIEYKDGFRVVCADVPGLIDGASEGRGRGFDFLRHLERTKALLYIVDAAGVDGRDPIEDLKILG
eukprot:2928069-Ditylum_brightwellii.AAC.1